MNHLKLADAVKRIAWSYLLLHLHINIGTLDILPDWAGHWMILSSLPVLAQQEPSADLLRPFGIILMANSTVRWVVTLFGSSLDIPLLSTLITVVNLYFHFQLLTNLASISEKYGCPETKRILTLRTVHTAATTLMALPLGWEDHEWAAYILIIAALVVVIWICPVLLSLRRSLEAVSETNEAEA